MALRIATKLRQELPTNQLATLDDKLLAELLRFDLAVVFAHLLGQQPPDCPESIMESSASLAQGADRVLEAAEKATRIEKPPFRYVVGNILRWRGPRRFEVALAGDREDHARWEQNWTVYRELSDLAIAQDPPLLTWNELFSRGVRFRRPMGLVLGNTQSSEAAGVFSMPDGPLTADCNLGDSPHEDSIEKALASLSSIGSSAPTQSTAHRAIKRLSRIAGRTCEEKEITDVFGATMADLAASNAHPTLVRLCRQIFREFGTVRHLEGVAFMFQALQRYYLQPWKVRAFYSFPDSILIRAGDRNLTSVLSVAMSANSLEEKHLWMLELATSKILGVYLHIELQQFFLRRDRSARRLAAEHRLKSFLSVHLAAETASDEIFERSESVTVGDICLPVHRLASVGRRFPKSRPESRLFGRLIIGGLAERLKMKDKFSRLNLALACGMLDPASKRGVLLRNILDEIEQDESLLNVVELAPAIRYAADMERLVDTRARVVVEQ